MAITQADSITPEVGPPISSTKAALTIVTSLFFMWGLVTAISDVLIPHLKSIFDLNYAKASLIQYAFFLAYFLFSIPAAQFIDRIGYKRTMVTGVMVMKFGALLFLPSAITPLSIVSTGAYGDLLS